MKRFYLCFSLLLLIQGCDDNGARVTDTGPDTSPATATVNVPTYSPGATTEITVTNTSATAYLLNPRVTLASWLADIATDQNLTLTGVVAPQASYTFSFAVSDAAPNLASSRENYQSLITNPDSGEIEVSADNLADPINPELNVSIAKDPSSLILWDDTLINADLWSNQPEILSATYDVEGIAGVEEGEENVIAAGGAWETVATPSPAYRALTSARTPDRVSLEFGYPTYLADAMTVAFSWPVLPSTVDRSDFAVTLNTGETVTPYVASISPNLAFNERSAVTLLGEFGNRIAPGQEGAIYPTEVNVVENLQLVGSAGPVSAVDLSKEVTSPYTTDGGPTLIAAKLSVMNDVGAGIGTGNDFSDGYPNGGTALYGGNAQYRLRLYTTGGISPDGVAAVLPTDFSDYFQIEVTELGVPTLLTTTGIPYIFIDGNIFIEGLADLGVFDAPLNDAYVADNDNYIDIILRGDDAAMRLITAVIIPATGPYFPVYNPGGPGNNPTAGVTYTSPGPAVSLPVTIAIDDPMTVSYP